MLGSYISAAYQSRPSQTVERFYDALLDWAGVTRPVAVTGGPAEVRWLESGSERIVFAFNHQGQPIRMTAALRAPGEHYSARDIVEDKPASVAVRDGSVILDSHLEPGQVSVVRLTPR